MAVTTAPPSSPLRNPGPPSVARVLLGIRGPCRISQCATPRRGLTNTRRGASPPTSARHPSPKGKRGGSGGGGEAVASIARCDPTPGSGRQYCFPINFRLGRKSLRKRTTALLTLSRREEERYLNYLRSAFFRNFARGLRPQIYQLRFATRRRMQEIRYLLPRRFNFRISGISWLYQKSERKPE